MEIRRAVSVLLPYKMKNGEMFVYLQKRDMNMERLPGYFGLWGGGREGNETADETLAREIKEELGIEVDMAKVRLFHAYTFLHSVKHAYLYEAADGWEDQLVIGEGDYGKWFRLDDVFKEPKLILEDKVILNDLERVLLDKSIR